MAQLVPTPPNSNVERNGTLVRQDFPQAVRSTIHIDSRDRNFDLYPSSSRFVIDLPETLKNVSGAVLVSAELPLSYYIFSQARGTTTLRVSTGGPATDVTIPDGNYSTVTMAIALETALNAAFSPTTFDVSFDASSLKCTIAASSGTVSIDTTGATKPTEWGLAYYLGFPRNAVTAPAASVTGTSVAALNPENYLLIDIEELNSIPQCALYSAGCTGRKSFAKVPLNGDSYQYNYYDKTLTYVHPRPQITKLDRLHISIRFHDGTLVDLNGSEWSMSVEFMCTLARSL